MRFRPRLSMVALALVAIWTCAGCSGSENKHGSTSSPPPSSTEGGGDTSDAAAQDGPDTFADASFSPDRMAPDVASDSSGRADADGSLASEADATATSPPPRTCLDPCSCDPPAGDPAHALAYTLGTPVTGCLISTNDIDYFSILTPAGQPGGAVVVSVSFSGLTTLDPAVFVAGDTTEIFNQSGAPGGSVSFWFAAAPSTQYLVEIKSSYVYQPVSPYTFTATYVAASTPLQPGGDKGSATPIATGSPVQALMFAGYTGHAINDVAWWQWYQLMLVNGNATVSITNVPSDLTLEAYLYDSTSNANTLRGYGSSTTAGGTINFTTSAPVTAGTYYLQVEPVVYTTHAYGAGTTPGALVTQPYTLTVTQ